MLVLGQGAGFFTQGAPLARGSYLALGPEASLVAVRLTSVLGTPATPSAVLPSQQQAAAQGGGEEPCSAPAPPVLTVADSVLRGLAVENNTAVPARRLQHAYRCAPWDRVVVLPDNGTM